MLLGQHQKITALVPISLSQVKQGSIVGITYVAGVNGSLKAVELHLYPSKRDGFKGLAQASDFAPDSILTEGYVSSISDNGDSLVLTVSIKEIFGNLSNLPNLQTIIADEKTLVKTFIPGMLDDLSPCADVVISEVGDIGDKVWRSPGIVFVARGESTLPMNLLLQ